MLAEWLLAAALPSAARPTSNTFCHSVGRALAAVRGLRQGATSAVPLADTTAAGLAAAQAADLQRARRLAVPVGAAAGVVGSVAGSGGAAVVVPLLSQPCPAIPQR